MDVVKLCKKYRKEGVVAIDLAGDESLNCEAYPDHKNAYEVRRNNADKQSSVRGIKKGTGRSVSFVYFNYRRDNNLSWRVATADVC